MTLPKTVCAALFCLVYGTAGAMPLVLPVPKQMEVTGRAPLRLSARTVLVVTSKENLSAAGAVRAAARALYPSLRLPIVRRAQSGQTAITFRTSRAVPHAEGYTIRTGPRGVTVTGHDTRGTWYGAQTLCQLLAKDRRGMFVPSVTVDDWPALSYRGALLFVGTDALHFHKKLIGRVLPRLKFNALVLECEGVEWNALGRDAPPNAMSKRDLSADVDNARAHFLSVTPLMEGIGHMGWLLNRHPEWAEDPQTPYALSAAPADGERQLFAVYDEALALFRAPALCPAFCIGGDEVNLRGRYPYRSRSQFPTLAAAFGAQTAREHAFLRKRGVQMWLWGDHLLAPGEGSDFCHAPNAAQARQIRAAVPKDVQVLDWHYGAAQHFGSLDTLRAAGFGPVIGATWTDGANIAGFSRALTQSNQRGLLQTIWAGYNQSEGNLRHQEAQFAALVIAADAAWNGGRTRLSPADAARVFRRLYGPRRRA